MVALYNGKLALIGNLIEDTLCVGLIHLFIAFEVKINRYIMICA